jgi:hypothetical protein
MRSETRGSGVAGRLVAILAAAALAVGCRTHAQVADRSTGQNRPSSTMEEPDTSGMARTLRDTALQAPHMIRGVETQLKVLDTVSASQDNLTAHKNLLGDMVSAMRADFNRVGVTDRDGFTELADSVLRDLGGGTGQARALDSAEVPAHIARVERLIRLYDSKMRQARSGTRGDSGTGA